MAGKTERVPELGGWDTEFESYGFNTSDSEHIDPGQLDLDSIKLLDIEDAKAAVLGRESTPGVKRDQIDSTDDGDLFGESNASSDPRDEVLANMQAELAALRAKVQATEARTKKLSDWKGTITQASKDNEIARLEGEMTSAWENGDQKSAYSIQKQLNAVQALVVKDDEDSIDTQTVKEPTPSEKIAIARLEVNGGRLNSAIRKLVDRNKGSISEKQVPFLKVTLADTVSEGHTKGWSDKDILIEFANRARLSITATPGKTGAKPVSGNTKSPVNTNVSKLQAEFNALHPQARHLWTKGGFDREYAGDLATYIEHYRGYTGE